MALRELQVENFRGIRSARVTLDPTTVLIGENDCGKSSLLEALALTASHARDHVAPPKSIGGRERGAWPPMRALSASWRQGLPR